VVSAFTVVLLVTALLAEIEISAVSTAARPYAANLPGIQVRNYPVLAPRWVFWVNTKSDYFFEGKYIFDSVTGFLRYASPAFGRAPSTPTRPRTTLVSASPTCGPQPAQAPVC
jgi:hypothetical protein